MTIPDSGFHIFLLGESETREIFVCGIWNPGKICMWNPDSWILESRIQLKESGIALIQNPSSTDKNWNPVPGIRNRRGQNPTQSWIPLHGAI